MNSAMRPTYDLVREIDTVELPSDIAKTQQARFILRGNRIYLAAHADTQTPPSDDLDDWEAERWTNEIHLSTDTPADDPSWRAELLGQGLFVARSLLAEATKLTALPVQAIIGLQSALGCADPEIDLACGSIHFYVIREPRDDASLRIEANDQPVLTLTEQAGQSAVFKSAGGGVAPPGCALPVF
jgi:hypothetical protein